VLKSDNNKLPARAFVHDAMAMPASPQPKHVCNAMHLGSCWVVQKQTRLCRAPQQVRLEQGQRSQAYRLVHAQQGSKQ
jgi:hypothetical protein